MNQPLTKDLGLRPFPPPEPIPETAPPWWALGILVFLAGLILVMRFSRKRFLPSPESTLQQALLDAQNTGLDIHLRVQNLQQQLRQALSRSFGSHWLSVTSPEVKNAWEREFPESDHQFAQTLTSAWQSMDRVKFWPASTHEAPINEVEFSQMLELVSRMLTFLRGKNEKIKNKG